jgi:histidyl-tRNA synthetase
MQCDFDTIGTRSAAADAEIALVIHDLFRAIGFRDFTIRLNNRMVLSGLLERLDLKYRSTPILRALDKLAKIGPDGVAEEMKATAETTDAQADEVLQLASIRGTNDEVLRKLEPLVAESETGRAGVGRLGEVLSGVRAAGVSEDNIELDVSIARGLDYYTGTIFETFLDALPGIGSVCSGGRYDNLAGLYTNQELPGVGASLGLDRLLAAMEELKMIEKVATPAPVFIPYFDKTRLDDYLRLAAALRAAGIGVEVYPEPKKLGQQLKYADRRGHRVALIAGANEFESGSCQVKDLQKAEQHDVPLEPDAESVIEAVKQILRQ